MRPFRLLLLLLSTACGGRNFEAGIGQDAGQAAPVTGFEIRVSPPDSRLLSPGTDFNVLYARVLVDGTGFSKSIPIDASTSTVDGGYYAPIILTFDPMGHTQAQEVRVTLKNDATIIKAQLLNEVPIEAGVVRILNVDFGSQ